MPAPRSALACAACAGAVAALAVAYERAGLALTVALLLVVAAGVLAAGRRGSIVLAVLAAALALQATLRDAGWVVAVDVVAVLASAGLAVAGTLTWRRAGAALLVPLRLAGGTALLARAAAAAAPAVPRRRLEPVARGLVLGLALTLVFGSLFLAADEAFANVVDRTLRFDVDAAQIAWRLLLGLAFAAVAGALVRAAAAHPAAEPAADATPGWVPGRIELRIAIAAVVAIFAAFVAVQLHVLFGGAGYVQRTTGLGYGEYARQGFVQLLAVAALTLATVAVAARRPDRTVRALLGVLCVLVLVVLVSAYHRLDLVESAYGLTRVRYAGYAIVAWFVAVFGLVLAAGMRPALAARLPAITAVATIAGVLAFSLSNPDARIAASAAERAADGRHIDVAYMASLSTDALPALERLPQPARVAAVAGVRKRLSRPDGLAGLNFSRLRAR